MSSQDTIFCGDNLAKYLGVVEIVPKKQTAIIVKGERLGAVDANKGDWVLCGKTVDTWKAGVCYRWTGGEWIPLQPEVNFATEYQACLIHLLDIPDLAQQAGHFGALFAKLLVTQKALIDNLVSNQAFIKKLVVKKLHIDTDPDSNQDFEAWFDEVNGLKINNAGEEVFKVDTAGTIYAFGAIINSGTFNGSIYSGPLELINAPPENIVLNLVGTNIPSLISPWMQERSRKRKGTRVFYGKGTYEGHHIYLVEMSYQDNIETPLGYWSLEQIDTDSITLIGENYTKTFIHQSGVGEESIQIDFGYEINYYIKTIRADYIDFVFYCETNTKTLKLKNLPQDKPTLPNIVWKDIDGFLRLS